MLYQTMLAAVVASQVGWNYDDEVVDKPTIQAPAKVEVAPQPPPRPMPEPVVEPIKFPPVAPSVPEPKLVPPREPVERKPTANPELPDTSVQERIDQIKAQTPQEPAHSPRRELPVVRTCNRAAARLAPRWRLADSTGKVWVAYDRDALVTHVRTVNAVLLAPEPIFVSPVVTAPIVELPPTTVVSTPLVSTPVVTSTYTTPFVAPAATFYSTPVYTGMGGGCAGGQCR